MDLPAYLQIEPSARCNLRCQMCVTPFRQDYGGNGGASGLMPFDMFEGIVDQFTGLKRLHLQGLGEPLLHPHFFDMAALATARHIEVTANSNLTLLDERTAEQCVTSGLRCLHVSIDGATPRTYERVRVNASFSRLLANLALLSSVREEIGSAYPALRMTVVVMRQNLHELPALVRLAAEFGMEEVFVQHLCHSYEESGLPGRYLPMQEFFRKQSLVGENADTIEHHFTRTRSVASNLGITLRLPHLPSRPVKSEGRRGSCDWPWTGMYITYQGYVMPCCMVATPDRINFGSVVEEHISTIWNGGAYAALRDQLSSGDPPEICQACSVFNGTF